MRTILDGIPATAPTLTVDGVTVRFWFDLTPPAGATVARGGTDIQARLPSTPFDAVAQLRTRAFFRPALTTNNPRIILESIPDALVFDPLNWRRQ